MLDLKSLARFLYNFKSPWPVFPRRWSALDFLLFEASLVPGTNIASLNAEQITMSVHMDMKSNTVMKAGHFSVQSFS